MEENGQDFLYIYKGDRLLASGTGDLRLLLFPPPLGP